MLALKYPEPILKPSSLLGFFSKTEIRETEKDFYIILFFPIVQQEEIDGFRICL